MAKRKFNLQKAALWAKYVSFFGHTTRLKTLNFCNLYWLMIIDLPFFVVEPFVYFRMFVFNRGFGVWKLGGQ